MKTKTGFQIVQAILVMLAMLGGMLLLPGNDVHSGTDCLAQEGTESVPRTNRLLSSSPRAVPACERAGTQPPAR